MSDSERIIEACSAVADRLQDYSSELVFWLNGERMVLENPDPAVLLADYLREIGLTGTKIGCSQGGCGACTVMISRRTREGERHEAINACLRPLAALAGTHVTTVEGIGNVHDGLDPVQHRVAINNGSQCGYCTPGFVMNMHALLRGNDQPTERKIEDSFGGNLCRCTGYRPILSAMRSFGSDYDPALDPCMKCEADPCFPLEVRSSPVTVSLADLPAPGEAARLHFSARGLHWIRPTALDEAMELKRLLTAELGRANVRVVVGSTAAVLYPQEKPRVLIDLSQVGELQGIAIEAEGLRVGAGVSIQRLLDAASALIDERDAVETAGLRELVRHGQYVAGIQVRNAGSIGGNIFVAASHTREGIPFPSDMMTLLATLGTTVTIRSADYREGRATFPLLAMPVAEDLPADALLEFFHVPLGRRDEYVQTYRVARRPQMAHAIINAGFSCRLDERGHAIPGEVRVIYGGVASFNGRMPKTEQTLAGKPWDDATLLEAMTVLRAECREQIVPMDEEGFTGEYREQLVESFFYKFFLHVAERVGPGGSDPANLSAAEHAERPLSTGRQSCEVQADDGPTPRSIVKRMAFAQATGEAIYPQDERMPEGGGHGVMVMSDRPHARFRFAGPAEGRDALQELLKQKFPGFLAIVTVDDIPTGGNNLIGLGLDDPVFSPGVVTHVGAPICLAVARDRATAKRAAEFIRLDGLKYDDLPAITTLEEAIKAGAVMPHNPEGAIHAPFVDVVREGSDTAWLAEPSKPAPGAFVVSGVVSTGAQAHFYLETFNALAIPGSYDEMTLVSSTQNPNGDQASIARVLGVRINQVNVRVGQIGGGFGGKQNRACFIAAAAAVAAHKLRRPVRIVYDRQTDMQMTGKRHPYRSDYHLAINDEGQFVGGRLDLHSEGGDTNDCSFAVIKGSVMMADGCYQIPTFRASGTVYRTNKASNTAMRTFGQVQPHLALEEAVEHAAHELGRRQGRKVRAEEIRRQNLYRSDHGMIDAGTTHFGQPLWFCDLREQWDHHYESCEFAARAERVEEFNRTNRWRKRGISMVPLKYGIGFKQLPAMNTSTALVSVNRLDGSVLVTHGGVEMGQGLHTKIAQVAAGELNLPLESIRVAGNSTDTIANAPPTAASTGFDLNGGAVALACRALRQRIEQFCREQEDAGSPDRIENWRDDWQRLWPEIVRKAWLGRVNLSAVELYKAPHHDEPTDRYPKGRFFAYFTYAFAVSEVEIDVLTGESTVLRADIRYDAGRSLNPAIDIGQIEGGYVQGLGFVTTEEIRYDEEGRLLTDNIWNYKPPCTKSIPLDLRVTLTPSTSERWREQEQARLLAVYSSKSASEPCLSLGNSAYFAIKHAVLAARQDLLGDDGWITLGMPATCQQIQQACGISRARLTLACPAAAPVGGLA
ncbi:molybdopterin cofactor-binding domain-containing protein [Singulisphaera acidiphila]|uniref:Xanthine dehydrogenase, molybdopterin-binding subunit B n=1 Tax=Singulisphaera acidiphila (strain ATCC BAA-1392 / DSM 18658 / VKM B-2454 / MOB10) TaxID=886293 RepID=L0D615_SINAD|nr:molybdopterin cofactor-binding domain-containing protein [Singulisphaera acidiphila]AGA24702.1 xanthine dehydrogenase, molybdopterin-binding subunit B [Singulisphaera acidiphila DSM 18658]